MQSAPYAGSGAVSTTGLPHRPPIRLPAQTLLGSDEKGNGYCQAVDTLPQEHDVKRRQIIFGFAMAAAIVTFVVAVLYIITGPWTQAVVSFGFALVLAGTALTHRRAVLHR